ncbi:MAG: sugar phosphate isomerase/epimerase [Anaerolineales bacterium]|nr:sugar phosphate isomerase/epimerase [Anaerolineales bacterium]
MKTCLGWACPSFDSFRTADLLDYLDRVARAGFCSVEPLMANPFQLGPGRIRQILQDRGLTLSGIRTGAIHSVYGYSLSHPDSLIRRKAASALQEVIRASAEVGEPTILIGLLQGKLDETTSLEQGLAWVRDGLADCLKTAEDAGVKLALEPINRYELGYNRTVKDMLQLVTDLEDPSVGMLLDTFHMNIEEADISMAIQQAGERIFHIHLADNNRKIPGRGSFVFSTFFKQLRKVGYMGPMTIECDEIADESTLSASMAYLRQYLQF